MKRFQRSHCDRKLSKQQVFNKSAITIRCRRIVVTVTHFSQSPSPSNPHQMNFRCRMRNCSAWDSSGPDSKVEGSTNSAQKKIKNWPVSSPDRGTSRFVVFYFYFHFWFWKKKWLGIRSRECYRISLLGGLLGANFFLLGKLHNWNYSLND